MTTAKDKAVEFISALPIESLEIYNKWVSVRKYLMNNIPSNAYISNIKILKNLNNITNDSYIISIGYKNGPTKHITFRTIQEDDD